MRLVKLPLIIGIALVGIANAQQPRQELPEPDYADVRYGPDERHVYDVWMTASENPTPPSTSPASEQLEDRQVRASPSGWPSTMIWLILVAPTLFCASLRG
jgi:hypothetical protein